LKNVSELAGWKVGTTAEIENENENENENETQRSFQ
jgi:hypothetical protein